MGFIILLATWLLDIFCWETVNRYGYAVIFECQIPCDLETACLRSLYQDVWDAKRYIEPKLRYYNLFKPDLSQEEYLNLNIPKYQRSLFAQFRGRVLSLQVEIGRFRKIPLEERLCNLCDTGQVEDEFHFLCICTNYSDLREVLYIKAARVFPAFSELDELEKFVYLLNNLQRNVIIYLNEAVSRRRSSLFNSWMYSNDFHASVLYCFLNVTVTYKPNRVGWFCLILCVYMMYMYITCHVNKDYVMLRYVMLCYAMLCYVMLCYVMLCYVMLCYVMLCYVMLYYVMLCYVDCFTVSSVVQTENIMRHIGITEWSLYKFSA